MTSVSSHIKFDLIALDLLAGVCMLLFFSGWTLVIYFSSPLRTFPGPFWAKWTNIWRLYHVWTGKHQWTMKKLHEKYGPIIRVGPNLLDLDYPELIRTLYSTDGKWVKTEFYENNSVIVDGKKTYHLFSISDQVEHARMKRPMAKYYSMSSILSFEPRASDMIGDLCGHLDKYADGENAGKDCDLGQWIAFFAWDFISSAAFGERFGFMDKANDFDGTIERGDRFMDYFSTVGQMPFLDHLLVKNPIMRIGPATLDSVSRLCHENMTARLKQGDAASKKAEKRDFLDHFIEAKKKSPDDVNEELILSYLQVTMLAGADTTAITLRAIFRFLMTNPHALEKLEQEILGAGWDPDSVVAYSAARALPYLDGVVRESMRMHPGVSMPLERYVPASGLTLPDGSFVPPGTAVGMNPFIVGRNEGVWGPDANEFRPERWLKSDAEDDGAYQQRLRQMNAADLVFGAGSRICIGRHMAMLETYKIAATLVLRYKILPPKVPTEFVIVSGFLSRQTGLACQLEKR